MCNHATSRPIADSRATSRQQFCGLVVNEPFRALFPLGMVLGVLGIAVWPLYHAGLLEIYPLAAHLRLMVYGFIGSFVFGFLFTAGPRLLGCPKPSKAIVSGFFISCLAVAGLAFLYPLGADILFLIQLLVLLSLGSYGLANRDDLPPPGFVLGISGLACAVAGTVAMIALSLGYGGAISYHLSRTLLFQAFPALPLIGIGAFFFPKLVGTRNPQDLPTNPSLSKLWLARASYAAATVAAFLISVALEIQGHHQIAYLLRAGALAAYLLLETPILKSSSQGNTQRIHLLVCSLSIVASFALIAFYPAQKTAWLHGFFVCGLTGSILLVATRVVYGHSGNVPLAIRSRTPLLWGIGLLALSASLRVLADYHMDLRAVLLVVASIIWLAIAAYWLLRVAPRVKVAEVETAPTPLAPAPLRP